jgi:MFS transporter, DHA1 family, inner membrane transport protein
LNLGSPTVRRALLALAVGGFAIGTGEFVTLGLLPNIASGLDVSIPRAGNLISAYALGVVVGAPLLTIASVHVSRKRFLVAMAAAMAVGNFASAVAPSFDSLVVVRFLTGMPHGAYFGVAAVVAAGLVSADRRASAMAVVFAGLTVANIVGVPITTLLGQNFGWRTAYALVGVIQVATVVAILREVPLQRPAPGAAPPSVRGELLAFKQPQIWLSLGIATIGGACLFCTFSYITPMMTHEAGYPEWAITPLLVLFGIGMTAGNLIGAPLADRWGPERTICFAMLGNAIAAAVFFFADRNKVTAAVVILVFPFCSLAMLPALQSRIIHLAGGAPNLAAASIQAAFNVANSLGAWLGGLAIAAGWGYGSPNLVASGLALCGFSIAVYSARASRASRIGLHDSGAPTSVTSSAPAREPLPEL